MKLMICANLDVGGLPALNLASDKIANWQEGKIEALAAALGDAREKGVDACVIAGGLFAKGFVAQIGQTLANIKAVVEAGGGKVEDIVRLTWYVTDIAAYRNSLAELGPVYRANFGRHFPAMAVVSVPALVEPEAMVDIEATAVLPS